VGGISIRAASASATTPAVTPDVLAPNRAAHGRPGAQAMRVEHTLVEVAQSSDRQENGWRTDPELATQVEEALARVPLRRRRVLLGVLDGLTQRQAVIDAGYHVGSPQSASQMAQQIMRDPAVQHAYQALLEARGLSGAKLDSIHALHLSRHSAVDGGDRDRSLRALALARKYVVPRPASDSKPALDGILDEMSPAELEQFAVHRKWPERFRSRLRALGFTRRDEADVVTPNAEAPDAADAYPDVTEPQPVRPPRPHPPRPEPDTAARVAHTDGDLDDDDEPPRRPTLRPAPAPEPITRRSPAEAASAAAQRAEDRVWPASSDRRASDLLAEIERDQAPAPPGAWWKRDCRW